MALVVPLCALCLECGSEGHI